MGSADAGVQEPEIVVDFRRGADRGARVLGRGLLIDGDRRRKAVDAVEVGLVHLAEELARVCREAFDVSALPLCVDGVEREARFAAARKARDDDQLIAWNGDIDVLQIMLAGSADDDGITCHSEPVPTLFRILRAQRCMIAPNARRPQSERALAAEITSLGCPAKNAYRPSSSVHAIRRYALRSRICCRTPS